MLQIVLIRPGSTEYDEQGRIQGTLDIPLSEQGVGEVKRIVQDIQNLGIGTIYCCPCQAAWETASAISEAIGAKLKKVDTLSNIDHGLWQGMLIDEVKRKQPKVFRQWQEQPEIICPPEGEMLAQAQDRVQTALAKLFKKHKQGVIALVIPEPLASVVYGYLCQSEIGDLTSGGAVCGKWDVIALHPNNLVPTQG